MSYGETLGVVSDQNDDDPLTYAEAMAGPESKAWQTAMDTEMHSMYLNNVWTLVDKPEGVKPIGCNWVYKKKRSPDGNVETLKA